MSKTLPGYWEAPPKPDVDYGLNQMSSLERIQANTSPAAIQIAARQAASFGAKFGDSGVFGDVRQMQGHSAAEGQYPPPSQFAQPPAPQANFDMIRDDYGYRIASHLYESGQCNDQIEDRRGTVYELHEDQLAILKITAGRTSELVDIDIFNSAEELYDNWEGLLANI